MFSSQPNYIAAGDQEGDRQNSVQDFGLFCSGLHVPLVRSPMTFLLLFLTTSIASSHLGIPFHFSSVLVIVLGSCTTWTVPPGRPASFVTMPPSVMLLVIQFAHLFFQPLRLTCPGTVPRWILMVSPFGRGHRRSWAKPSSL